MTKTNKESALRALMAVAMLSAVLSGCAGSPTHESTGELFDDSLITTKVKTALLDHKNVSARAVSVETFKGTVQLSGFVNSEDERQRAEDLAKSVRGVKSVVNGIEVK